MNTQAYHENQVLEYANKERIVWGNVESRAVNGP